VLLEKMSLSPRIVQVNTRENNAALTETVKAVICYSY